MPSDFRHVFAPNQSCVSCRAHFAGRGTSGSALLIVLAFLVLLSGVILAYFSRTLDQRRVSAMSATNTRATLLGESAIQLIIGDLLTEIEAGSDPDTLAAGNRTILSRVMQPTMVSTAAPVRSVAPSIVPQRAASDAVNIVKKSRAGIPFYTPEGWYADIPVPKPNPIPGPTRASAVSTLSPSLNGRFVSAEDWKKPRLLTTAEETSFTPPDWIYLDRDGKNPTDFSSSALDKLKDQAPANRDFAVGRFAYVIYDVGGLIDINIVGNSLGGVENARRGRLHQISLENGIAGIPIPKFQEFLTWRAASSKSNASSAAGDNGLFDPHRTFLEVPQGDQAFLNRQDLIKFTARTGTQIPAAALPYLTTFSRELTAPAFRPDPLRSKLPTSPNADAMNPAILSVRFTSNTTLSRGGENPVTVLAGTPVMPRKFPLPKIDLLAEANPNPAMLSYYFGLIKRADGVFEYTAASADKRILKLSEVAKLGREPNFFEVLQATILTGSLGKFGEDTYGYEATMPGGDPGPDKLQNLQILRIGANIIDQWDANNIPTRLEYPVGSGSDNLRIFGIENLPYISQVSVAAYRPSTAPNTFQVWAVFDVWNPHQNSGTPPADIQEFRIVPVAGSGKVDLYYIASSTASVGKWKSLPALDVVALNTSRPALVFPATGNYTSPTKIGASPESGVPGILLNEGPLLNPSIPARPLRNVKMQQDLNMSMLFASRLAPTLVPPPPSVLGSGPKGQYVYPLDTVFSTFDPAAWHREDTPTGILVSANYGIKAHNYMRIWPEPDPYVFDLQAKIDGNWVTCQSLEDWFRQSDGPWNPADSTPAMILENTWHEEPVRNELKGFYTWMAKGGSCGMIRTDPRTFRFGSSGVNAFQHHPTDAGLNDFTGCSVRESRAPVPVVSINQIKDADALKKNWLVGKGNYKTGLGNTTWSGFDYFLVSQIFVPSNPIKPLSFSFGLASNHPDLLNKDHPLRYSDSDGVVRPADAYLGCFPLARPDSTYNSLADRPLVLNRPFRSVAEMGYVFRDMPWKTVDFFSRRSGDLSLLSAFSLEDAEEDPALVAGRVSLNTPHSGILSLLLEGSARQLPGMNPSLNSSALSSSEAALISSAMVTESRSRPFLNAGDIVSRVLDPPTGASPLTDIQKTRREAAIRALASVGDTRTWNLLIDVVAQTGRFTKASLAGADFMVQGECHYWVHVAIDRLSGKVVDVKWEAVHD